MKILMLLFACAVLGGCAKEESNEILPDKSDRLHLIATLGTPNLTRASILGHKLPEGARLGVSLLKTRNGALYDNSESNLPWEETSTGWTSPNAILLNDEEGTAYAYYPYNHSVRDIEAIPITLDQVDYCWGSSLEQNLSVQGTSRATIVLEHALARIALKVYKKDYPDAILSRIQIRNREGKSVLCTNTEGVTFSAKTGEIKGIRPNDGAVVEFTSGDTETFIPVVLQDEVGLSPTFSTIILPTADFESGDMEFVLTINNQEFTVPIPKPKSVTEPAASGGWNSKYSYTYEVQLTGTGLSTTGVSLVAWVDLPFIDLDINQNASYSYSEDGKFLYYKKQAYNRVIGNDSTSVNFIIYSNDRLTPSTLTASFSKEGISGGNIQVTSRKIDPNITDVGGEKVLGDWMHTIEVPLKANMNDPNPRKVDVTLASSGSKISTFQIYQEGVDTRALEDVLVEIGGLKWMPFNTSGVLANDVAIAKGISTAGGIVNYAYANVANFRKVSGTYFKGSDVLAQKVCPNGYRVPTLQEYTDMFGQAVPVRPGTTPKWLSENPRNGELQLPNGVLKVTPHANNMNVITVYWTFVSNGQTLPFVGAGNNGKVGTNQSANMRNGIGIWTCTERTKNNLERVAPWVDGWANNSTSKTTLSQARCVKE